MSSDRWRVRQIPLFCFSNLHSQPTLRWDIKIESIIWIERGICTEDKEMQWPPPTIQKKQSCGSVAWHSSPELRIANCGHVRGTYTKKTCTDWCVRLIWRLRTWPTMWFLRSIACPLLHTFLLPLFAPPLEVIKDGSTWSIAQMWRKCRSFTTLSNLFPVRVTCIWITQACRYVVSEIKSSKIFL